MLLKVLGSAAAGGFPQWNCCCRLCRGARARSIRARPRWQSSLAVSEDGDRWLLVDATSDVRGQVEAFLPLHPPGAGASGARSTRLTTVLLTGTGVDCAAGLLSLGESAERLQVFCAAGGREALARGLAVQAALAGLCGVDVHEVGGDAFKVPGFAALEITAVPVAGGATAFAVRDARSGKAALLAPRVAAVDERLRGYFAASNALLVDGAVPVEELAAQAHARRVLVRMDHADPILDEDSAERRAVEALGIEVAADGLSLRV